MWWDVDYIHLRLFEKLTYNRPRPTVQIALIKGETVEKSTNRSRIFLL